MIDEPLDELYFSWLYSQVADPNARSPRKSWWRLAKQMHLTEFVWFVANDDNRVEDGRDLRFEFLSDANITLIHHHDWLGESCSFLEMMVALARRLAFLDEIEEEATEWFWHLMANIGLRSFTDYKMNREDLDEDVAHILEVVIWRNYQPNGRGGLFPLKKPREDQRAVELWYQLSSYLIEGNVAC